MNRIDPLGLQPDSECYKDCIKFVDEKLKNCLKRFDSGIEICKAGCWGYCIYQLIRRGIPIVPCLESCWEKCDLASLGCWVEYYAGKLGCWTGCKDHNSGC